MVNFFHPFRMQRAAANLSKGLSTASGFLPSGSTPGIPLGGLLKIAAVMIPLITFQYNKARQAAAEASNQLERRLMQRESAILAKKRAVFEQMERFAKLPILERDLQGFSQKLAQLGQQLILLQKLKDKFDVRKEKIIRRSGRGFFMRAFAGLQTGNTERWVERKLRKVDDVERVLSLREEHILQIMEHVVEFIEHKELRDHPTLGRHVATLDILLRELIRMTATEVQIEGAEEAKE